MGMRKGTQHNDVDLKTHVLYIQMYWSFLFSLNHTLRIRGHLAFKVAGRGGKVVVTKHCTSTSTLRADHVAIDKQYACAYCHPFKKRQVVIFVICLLVKGEGGERCASTPRAHVYQYGRKHLPPISRHRCLGCRHGPCVTAWLGVHNFLFYFLFSHSRCQQSEMG